MPFCCLKALLFQRVVVLIIYGFEPFRFPVFPGNFNGQMLEPAVLGRAVPVLDTFGNIDDVAGMKLAGFFSPFLVPAASADADQHLSAAFTGMMDMPVIPAAGFKGDVKNGHLRRGERGQIALPDKILRIRVILFPHREDGEIGRHAVQFTLFLAVHFGNQGERAPGFGPAAVEGKMAR